MVIHELPIKSGITLNLMHIYALSIVMSSTQEELISTLECIDNINDDDIMEICEKKTLDEMKLKAFQIYKQTILSIYDAYYATDAIRYSKKRFFDAMSKHLQLDEQEREMLNNAIEQKNHCKSIHYIKKKLPSKYNSIFDYIDNVEMIESVGFKWNDYENFVKLSHEILKYDVLNLVNIINYKTYIKLNGNYNHKKLSFALDFARKLNKKVRLGPCLFYGDTPQWINKLKYNEKNKYFIYNLLSVYIYDISQFIKKYEDCFNINIVETIELIREPLNTLHEYIYVDGFATRRYIYWDSLRKRKRMKNRNTSPGWFRFLDIDDVCKLCTIVRHNLPNIKIMLNECKLENRNKARVFIEDIIKPIQAYEKENNIKLLDIVGTQCHCSMHVIPEDFRYMFETLSKTGIPVEITEFDVFVQPDMFNACSIRDLHMYKSAYMDDLYDVIIKNYQKFNIAGFTIWSINDTMNDMVKELNDDIFKKNQIRIRRNLKPNRYLTNIFGGYYTSNMEERPSCPEYQYD